MAASCWLNLLWHYGAAAGWQQALRVRLAAGIPFSIRAKLAMKAGLGMDGLNY
jgi:hypothetical protein